MDKRKSKKDPVEIDAKVDVTACFVCPRCEQDVSVSVPLENLDGNHLTNSVPIDTGEDPWWVPRKPYDQTFFDEYVHLIAKCSNCEQEVKIWIKNTERARKKGNLE